MSDLSAIKLNGTTYTLSDDYARDSMAKIEYGTLATKAYAVGDFLINNNHLYKVTSAIAIGVKFVVGTNIELVKLTDEVKLKAPLASPNFTGTPKVPTASTGTKTTQIASTAYVQNEIDIVNNNVQSTIDYVQNELGGVLTSLRGDLNSLDSEVDTISDDVDSLDSAVDILTRQGTTLRNDGIVVCNAVDGGDNVFFMIDDTLTEAHKAADAKATGDAISSLNEDITNLETNKQDVLTFDSAPTVESTNPVTSAGIKMALDSVDAEIGELKENLSELQNGGYIADAQQIQEKVDNYLDEHPEATTTVEDGSLTESQFSDELKLNLDKHAFDGTTINPIYIGDYICPSIELPGCCVRIGDYFYSVNSLTREEAKTQRSNVGKIRRFDLNNNVEDVSFQKSADVGHANSIAYDGEYIYIAPIWDTTSGEEVTVQYLYKYDASFNPIGTETIPTTAQSVSYDWVTGSLYYYDYRYNVYKKTANGWLLYSHIDFTNVSESIRIVPGTSQNGTFNQDFAVYNSRFYCSSIRGSIVYGALEVGTSYPVYNYIVNALETTGRYHLGELEGMEFSNDGHLYAIDYVSLTEETRNAFVVELHVGTAVAYSTNLQGNIFGVSDGTYIISETTQKKFALGTYEIRTANQLLCMTLSGNGATIQIPDGETVIDPYLIRITQDIQITVDGNYTVKCFSVLSGTLSFASNNDIHSLTVTSTVAVVLNYRNGIVKFASSHALRIATPNISNEKAPLVAFNYSQAITIVRLPPVSLSGKQLTLGLGVPVNGISYGGNNVYFFQKGETYTLPRYTTLNGLITAGLKELYVFIQLPKSVRWLNKNEISISGKLLFRTTQGYLNGSTSDANLDISNYTKVIEGPENAILLIIRSDTAFTNATNNTPIVAFAQDDALEITFG